MSANQKLSLFITILNYPYDRNLGDLSARSSEIFDKASVFDRKQYMRQSNRFFSKQTQSHDREAGAIYP